LIQGLFPFIVSSTDPGSPLTANGVDFINKNNAWGLLFGLTE
jgi:hypothetical protein